MNEGNGRAAAIAEQAADDAVKGMQLAKQYADEAAKERQRVEQLVPDPRQAVVNELAALEGGALLRIGPKRQRWRELQKFDEQLAELEMRREELTREIGTLRADVTHEPNRHAQAIAQWIGAGNEGPRPEARTAKLERELADKAAEHAALGIRYDTLLRDRAAHVSKFRKAMRDDVQEAKEQTAAEYAETIDKAERLREELLALRASEVWVAVYPSETLTSEPNTQALVGAKKRLQEPHLPGLQSGLVALSIFNLLRADARFCASVATAEQAAAERGVSLAELTQRDARWEDERKADFIGPRFDATWGGSPEEAVEAERVRVYTESQRRLLAGDPASPAQEPSEGWAS